MAVILEDYQVRVVDALVEAFGAAIRDVDAPRAAVLKAPTASGKTVMLARALSEISSSGTPTVWFWFAPFDNIVVQSERTIRSEAGEALRPRHLRDRTWGGHRAGDVWISTHALASSSKAGPAEDTEFSPSLRSMADRISRSGLRIGVVIDEAHLNAKQKGRFIEACRLIAPDVIFAATATPKDEALDKFFRDLSINSASSVTVERAEAVQRHLNKEGLWARIVSVDGAGQQAKLEALVRATWRRHRQVQAALDEAGVDVQALALFQADNKAEGERMLEAVRDVTGLTAKEIAFYDSESKSKGQRGLNEIADDPEVKALVFKVAAGTGFDAPRAFCLGSARTVRDETSAAQFVGRIMRVPRALRAFLFANPEHPLRGVLNNAHLFLIDDEAQTGFAAVVQKICGSFAAAGMSEVSVRRTDAHGADLEADQPENEAHRAEVLRRAGEVGEGYPDLDALADALGEDLVSVMFPRHGSFEAPLTRQEWRHDEDSSGADILEKLRGAVITPQRVKDRLERARLVSQVTESGDDLTTAIDEGEHAVRREVSERGARADFLRSFEVSASLIPGISEAGASRALLRQMTEEVIATGETRDPVLANRIAMMIAAEFHGEMKTAATKGDGAGLILRNAAPLPDAYLVHGAFSRNAKAAYCYHVLEGAYVEPDEGLMRFLRDLAKAGMIVGGRYLTLAVSDKRLTVNVIEKALLDSARASDSVVSVLRNPDGKPYSAAYANIGGQNRLFYPDFVVALADGRRIAIETKYDRKDLREKMAGRGEGAEALPVLFVVRNENTRQLELVEGYDGEGREITRLLDFSAL